ncbi:MAG: hypothetical protein RL341_2054 [Pseudomonadota bacterium]|jgi:hypothetical protein
MSDLFSELEALKGGGGPDAVLLRQVRALPSVRETAKNCFTVDRSELRFVQKDGKWIAQIIGTGRTQTLPLQNALDHRKLIDKLKLLAAGRDDE